MKYPNATQRVLALARRGLSPLALTLLAATACLDDSVKDAESSNELVYVDIKVTVDPSAVRQVVPPYAYAMHTSVYDNSLHDANVPDRLSESGITMLRYPGGGYSDNYHWSNHTMTPWSNGDRGYLAAFSDFGSYVSVIDRAGVAVMITANYGSNLHGTGGGEPAEAAAWVAYANGDPDDETIIGEDSVGNDWRTVGYWASLRAAEPLDDDDPENILRIAHPEPMGIVYWEIGNEVFGNGYHDAPGFELDLHVPYDGPRDSGYPEREGHPDLSGTKYGSEVLRYVEAMKAVDPSIKVGAVLNTPPSDYSWGPNWNRDVLRECATQIDFAIIHWYPREQGFLQAPADQIPKMFEELQRSFREHAPDHADDIEVVVTELGNPVGSGRETGEVGGVFAADAYLGFITEGATNVTWLELHNGTFLSERDDRRGPAFLGISLANRVAAAGDAVVHATSSRDDILTTHAGKRQDDAVAVMLVNGATRTVSEVTVEIEGDALARGAEMYRYTPRAEGDAGDRIDGPTTVNGTDNRWEVTVDPESLTVLVIPPK